MFKRFLSLVTLLLSFFCIFFSNNSNSNKLYFPIHKRNYYISSYFEYRTLGTYHFHNGIDIPEPEGTPLYAISYGTVSFVGFIFGYGHSIIIKYDNGYKTLYGHISPNYIANIGDRVNPNTKVALVGPKYLKSGKLNGFTTGQHLHFTLYYKNKCIDPLSINNFEHIKN